MKILDPRMRYFVKHKFIVHCFLQGSETDLSKQWLLQNGRISTFSQSGDIGAPSVSLSDGER